jgi:hypothetical protein
VHATGASGVALVDKLLRLSQVAHIRESLLAAECRAAVKTRDAAENTMRSLLHEFSSAITDAQSHVAAKATLAAMVTNQFDAFLSLSDKTPAADRHRALLALLSLLQESFPDLLSVFAPATETPTSIWTRLNRRLAHLQSTAQQRFAVTLEVQP